MKQSYKEIEIEKEVFQKLEGGLFEGIERVGSYRAGIPEDTHIYKILDGAVFSIRNYWAINKNNTIDLIIGSEKEINEAESFLEKALRVKF